MVCWNGYEGMRMIEVDGERVFEYTEQDRPRIRQMLMGVMQRNKDPALSAAYQEMLLHLFDADEHGQAVDSALEDSNR
ncbi:MAG: hypothetical protein ABIH92_02490 [Nanoarchaeota archaeon]